MSRVTASIAMAAMLIALPAGSFAAQPGTGSLESDFLDQLSDWIVGQVASAAALWADGGSGEDDAADSGREGSAVDATGFTGPIIVPPNESFTGPIIVPPGEGQLGG